MRIDLNSIFASRITGEKSANKAKGSTEPEAQPGEDTAILSDAAASVQTLQAQVMQMPDVRQEAVSGLQQQVRQGEYEVEPEKVADAIIAEHSK